MSARVPGRIPARAPTLASLAAALWVAALLTPAGVLASNDSPEPRAVPGQLLVGFEEKTDRSDERAAVAGAGAAIEQRLDSIDGAVVEVEPGSDIAEVERALARDRDVAFVEPNYVLRAVRLPNDRAFGVLWGLYNRGQYGGRVGADVNATTAWDVLTGGSTTVAVVDTGIAYDHPDLNANIWANPGELPNGIDDDGNGFVDDLRGFDFIHGDSDPYDDAGHGTHVAGIVGAEGNNGTGVVGVNWRVRLMALKFLNANGEGNTADAAQAIDYAVDEGADVINASWGGPSFSYTLYEAVKRASNRGVLFVAAAGNNGANSDFSPDYPAAFSLPNVISVAASDRSDRLLSFSNYGGRSVDLAAPGDEIYSTVPGGYASFSGTSMAAPFVSGAAALYLAGAPGSSPEQVRSDLLRSVDSAPSFASTTVSGGRLNVARALGVATSPSRSRPSRDVTPPSRFRLLRPRNRYVSRKRRVRFRWRRSHDKSGIRQYRLYVDGRVRKTLRDPDGPAGRRTPSRRARLRLSAGRHRWFVRAYDYAGNRRTSVASRRTKRSSVLYIGRKRR